MGDEQRVSWQELLAQSRDDFEADHAGNVIETHEYNGDLKADIGGAVFR